MTNHRTAAIHINAEQQTKLLETIRDTIKVEMETILAAIKADGEDYELRQEYKVLSRKLPEHEFYKAIGYLTTYNYNYPVVEIHLDMHNNTDLIAVYRLANNTVGYTLAAIWRETYYSFHS